jgi:hypothetical protein
MTDTIDAWEHTHVQVSSTRLSDLTKALNDLGADGWELVSTHSTDPTLGFNSITALMRRRIVALAPPRRPVRGMASRPVGPARGPVLEWAGVDVARDHRRRDGP